MKDKMEKLLVEVQEKLSWAKGHKGEYERQGDSDSVLIYEGYIVALEFVCDLIQYSSIEISRCVTIIDRFERHANSLDW